MSLMSVSAAVFEVAASPDWTALNRLFRSVRSVDCVLSVSDVVDVEADEAEDVELLVDDVLDDKLSSQL